MAENEGATAPKTVEVPVDQLQQLIDNQKKQAREIEILRESVNQGRLGEAEDKRKEKELPKAFLKVYSGKVVVGWKAGSNKLVYSPTNANMVIGEVLQTTLKYLDGTEETINQQELTRTEDRVWVRIQSLQDLMAENVKAVKVKFERVETSNQDLKESLALPTEEVEIEKVYLNP